MQNKKIEIGDIFEIQTSKGKGYLQCVEIPKGDDVELVKVFYDLYNDTPSDINSVTTGNYFLVRFPVKASLRMKIVKFVEKIELPKNFQIPLFYRTINPFGEGWQIVNSKTLKRDSVLTLTEEQMKLSPWGGMNDTLIKELLEKGWRLESWTSDNFFD
jgi:hypothetical protein